MLMLAVQLAGSLRVSLDEKDSEHNTLLKHIQEPLLEATEGNGIPD